MPPDIQPGQIRLYHENYPTRQKCEEILRTTDFWLVTLSNPQPLKYSDLDLRLRDMMNFRKLLVKFMELFDNARERIIDCEEELEDVLTHLTAIEHAPANAQELENFKKRKAELEALMEKIKDPEGADELKGLQTLFGGSYLAVASEFFGHPARAKANIPTHSEKILAAHYLADSYPNGEGGFNQEKLSQFFSSEEYKQHRKRLNQILTLSFSSPEEDAAAAFMEAEFAKLATLHTPDERAFFMDALNTFYCHIIVPGLSGSPLSDRLQQTFSGSDKTARAAEGSAGTIKGKSSGLPLMRYERVSALTFEMYARYQIAKGVHGHHIALPSLAFYNLFAAGELRKYGMDDDTFCKNHLHYDPDGHYLGGVSQQNGRVTHFNGKEVASYDVMMEEIAAAIGVQMEKIAAGLVPTLNALRTVGPIVSPTLKLGINNVHNAIEVLDSHHDGINHVGRVNYEKSLMKQQQEIAAKIFGPEDEAPKFNVQTDLDKFHEFPTGTVVKVILERIQELARYVGIVHEQKTNLAAWKERFEASAQKLETLREKKKVLTEDLLTANLLLSNTTLKGQNVRAADAENDQLRTAIEAEAHEQRTLIPMLQQARVAWQIPHALAHPNALNTTNVLENLEQDGQFFTERLQPYLEEAKKLIAIFETYVVPNFQREVWAYEAVGGKPAADPRFAEVKTELPPALKNTFNT